MKIYLFEWMPYRFSTCLTVIQQKVLTLLVFAEIFFILTLTLNSRSSLKEVEMSEFVLVPVLLLAFCSYVTLHLSPVDTPTLFLLVCSYPLAFILLFYVFSYFHPFFFGLVFLLHTARDILLLLTYLSV